jgi:hypothetical protein
MSAYAGPEIPNNGLVLALDAANAKSYPGSGTAWTDLSGRGNSGTLANGPTYSSANGGSIVFDGTNDFVQQIAPTLNLSAGVTMEMMFKSNDIFGRAQGFMRYNYAPTQYYLNFYADGSGTLRWESWSPYPTSGSSIFTPTLLSNSTWYHAVGTYASGASVLYINGSSVATGSNGTGNFPSSYTTDFFIVGEYAGYCSGNIAVAKIYNRALTAAEVTQNFNALRGRYGI